MSRTSYKLTGFAELEKALVEELPKATAKNVLKRAGIAAMKPVEERARQLAPVDDGQLRDSITTKQARAKRQRGSVKFDASSGVEIVTGPTGRQEGGNAAFQEFGTVNMPANPFMRPAIDSSAQEVIADVRKELEAQIEKARKRIARKAARGA